MRLFACALITAGMAETIVLSSPLWMRSAVANSADPGVPAPAGHGTTEPHEHAVPAAPSAAAPKAPSDRQTAAQDAAQNQAPPSRQPCAEPRAPIPAPSSGDFLNTHVRPPVPALLREGLWGVDISRWQGKVDVIDLAQRKVEFVFLKATQGAVHQDADYRGNIASLRRLSIRVGSYHFFDNRVAVRAQLENFYRSADVRSGDLAPVIDVETVFGPSDGSGQDAYALEVSRFAEGLFQRYKVKPIIYTSRGFANRMKLGTRLAQYPLWISEWGVAAPTTPHGWGRWVFWQYSDNGVTAGRQGKIDENVFRGDEQLFSSVLIP